MLAFIRHGATQANKEKRYLGKTDESLSEEGKELLKSYKTQKIYPDVQYLFTSPMKRCTQTAAVIYPALCPIIIPEWEEIDFGRFEYKNYKQLQDDTAYQKWLQSGGTLDFPEGESRKDFILRCRKGFLRMCKEWKHAVTQDAKRPAFIKAKPEAKPEAKTGIGLIVHGGIMMSLLSFYGGTDYFDYQAPNGRGYVCRLTGVNDRIIQEDDIQENDIQIKVEAEI